MESFSPADTYETGRKLGTVARAGMIYCLSGGLGAGKTVFAKGFAAGLGVTDTVSSPTFTIVHYYGGGRLPLYHMDVYRIGDIGEMEEIGYEDCFYGGGVTLVEWPELIEGILPEHTVRVTIAADSERGADYRRITLEET